MDSPDGIPPHPRGNRPEPDAKMGHTSQCCTKCDQKAEYSFTTFACGDCLEEALDELTKRLEGRES